MSWPRPQIRYLARMGTGHTPSRSHPEYWEDCTVPWLTLADVHQLRDGTRIVIDDTSEKISVEGIRHSSAVPHPAGTVAMSRTASVGFSCIMGTTMATSQDFVTWTCGDRLDNRFLLWAIRGERAQILSRMQGSTHKTIYMPDLEDLRISLPPLAEQREVADSLDAETARIDALIAKKQQLIHLLEERLQCASDDIVGGLLQRCDLVPLKYVVRESDRRLGPGREAEVLSVSIHHGVVPRSEIDDRESRADDFSLYKLCMTGEIVLNRMRAFQGGVGVVRQEGIVSPDYTVMVSSKQLLPDFLHFLMRSQWFVGEMVRRLRGIGSTDQGAVRTPRVNYADLGLIEIPVPTIDEQQRLAGELHHSTQRTTKARDRLRRQLELLSEHRQAIITAAVASSPSVPVACSTPCGPTPALAVPNC